MTMTKPIDANDLLVIGDYTEYQLGLVVKNVPNFPKPDAAEEEFIAHFYALSVESRIEKLRQRIGDMDLDRFEDDENDLRPEQFRSELSEIERLYKDGSLRDLGRKDPLRHAMRALQRLLDIADTEQYFQTLAKHDRNAKARANALQRNRAAVAHFPPGSHTERQLVKDFDAKRTARKLLKNIPAMLHADYSKNDPPPSLMAIRRALQRLAFIPRPKPRKQK